MMSEPHSHHPSYKDYVDKFVPPANRPLLETVLDQGDDTERHLLEIAHYITDWEVKLVVPLGLTREEVEGIKGRTSDPELRRRQVLTVWKDKEGLNATYGRLLDKCLQGKDSRTAQKICDIVAQAAPSSSSLGRQQESDDERHISITVVKENRTKIKGSFATLVTNISTNLMKKNIDMGELRLYITTLFPPGDFVAYAKSVAEVCEAMSHHQLWDFHSFTPVEEIVKKFGENDPQLTGWIRDYKSELAGFKAVTRIADYIEACSDDEDIADSEQSISQNIARYDKKYCRKLSIKLKARITEKSLDYIDQFWSSIADYFFLPSLSVLLDTIKEGCVEVTWLVPTAAALQIEANMEDSEDVWRNLEVTRVEMDGVVYYSATQNMQDNELPEALEKRYTDSEVLKAMEEIFLDACKTGDIDRVEAALKYKVNVDATELEDEDTPLMISASIENYKLADLLFRYRVNVDKANKHGYTALMMAAGTGYLDMVELLLQHNANVNAIAKDGATALKLACMEGLLEMVKLLVDRGAEINAGQDWTPLTVAACEGHLEICQFLLDHGALVDFPLAHGNTPLMVAIENGELQVVKLLLKYGAKVDVKLDETTDGSTALLRSCQAGHLEIVKTLVAHGASVNMPLKNGATALIIASQGGHLEVMKFLLQMKAQVNDQTKDGLTALICATYANHPAIVAELLAHGADTELANTESGSTPLIIATTKNLPKVVELLLEAKANVDYTEKSGRNALMIAASRGNLPVLKMLIKHGSDLSLKAKGSEATAYDIASFEGHSEVCEELQKHGYQITVPPTEPMRREVVLLERIQNYLDRENIQTFREALHGLRRERIEKQGSAGSNNVPMWQDTT